MARDPPPIRPGNSSSTSGRSDSSSSGSSDSSSSGSSDSSSVPSRRTRSHSCGGARKVPRCSEPQTVGGASHARGARSGGRQARVL
eukprot:2075608-Lingulodinium_polyedra.AAC.1